MMILCPKIDGKNKINKNTTSVVIVNTPNYYLCDMFPHKVCISLITKNGIGQQNSIKRNYTQKKTTYN